jgi:hypothetical protein
VVCLRASDAGAVIVGQDRIPRVSAVWQENQEDEARQ